MSQTFPPVRLAALDLDGTLLNHEGQVTPRTRAALQAASDRGVVIVPTTGRPLGNLPPVVAQLPGVRYAITSNGAAVWDLGSDPLGAVYSRYANAAERQTSEPTCLLRRLMPVETARAAFDLFMEYPGSMGVFWNGYSVKDQASVDFAAARWARLHSTEARQPNDGRFLVVRDLGEWMSRHAHEVEKQCLFFAEQDQVPQALARFRAMPGVEVVQGSPENIEVTAAGVDKGEALRALADRMLLAIVDTGSGWVMPNHNLYYSIKPDGTYVEGDYPYLTYNDLYDLRKYLSSSERSELETLTYLMGEKLQWMQKNGVTGYEKG